MGVYEGDFIHRYGIGVSLVATYSTAVTTIATVRKSEIIMKSSANWSGNNTITPLL